MDWLRVQRGDAPLVGCIRERMRTLEQQARPLVVVGPESERVLVLRRGNGEAVQGECAVARIA